MRSRLSERRSSQSMSALVCGLDIHKESTYATILSPDGEIVTRARSTLAFNVQITLVFIFSRRTCSAITHFHNLTEHILDMVEYGKACF